MISFLLQAPSLICVLTQTPWGLTGRAWLQAGAQQVVIVVIPSFNSLGIDSRNVFIQENVLKNKEDVVRKVVAILPQPQCVKITCI